jgi:hypothetical protein
MMRIDPGLAASPFALLDVRGSLRLVTDRVHEDDALCLALACRALRDALWARFPQRSAIAAGAPARLRTRDAAVATSVSRLAWLTKTRADGSFAAGPVPGWLAIGQTFGRSSTQEEICTICAGVGAVTLAIGGRVICTPPCAFHGRCYIYHAQGGARMASPPRAMLCQVARLPVRRGHRGLRRGGGARPPRGAAGQ